MGLDANLYYFPGRDTDALLRLVAEVDRVFAWVLQDDSSLLEGLESQLAEFQSAAAAELDAFAVQLGFPAHAWRDIGELGQEVSLTCPHIPHAALQIGAWDNYFGTQLGMLAAVFDSRLDVEFFPELETRREWIKPNWASSRQRIIARLDEVRALGPRHRRVWPLLYDEQLVESVFAEMLDFMESSEYAKIVDRLPEAPRERRLQSGPMETASARRCARELPRTRGLPASDVGNARLRSCASQPRGVPAVLERVAAEVH